MPAANGEMLLSWPPGPDKGRRVRITRTLVGDGDTLPEPLESRRYDVLEEGHLVVFV